MKYDGTNIADITDAVHIYLDPNALVYEQGGGVRVVYTVPLHIRKLMTLSNILETDMITINPDNQEGSCDYCMTTESSYLLIAWK